MIKKRVYTRYHWLLVLVTVGYVLAAGVAAVVTGNGEFVFYVVVMVVLCVAVWGIDRRVGFSVGLLAALSAWGAMHMAGGLLPVPEGWPINGENRVVYSWWVLPFVWGDDGRVVWGIKYDHVTHAYGFGVTCWACWEGLRGAIAGYRLPLPPRKGAGGRVGVGSSGSGDAGPAADPHPGPPPERGREAARATARDNRPRPTFGLVVLCFAGALGFGALNEVVEFAATMLGPTNVVLPEQPVTPFGLKNLRRFRCV